MESQTSANNGKAVLKFKVMVINTAELKKVLKDEDFDGITLQLSQEIGNTPDGGNVFGFIAYKHFASKKKQELITDPEFFANNNGADIFKNVEVGGDGASSHFGNLKLTRSDLKEDIDTDKFPFLVLSPEHGSGDHSNYIVCKATYTETLKDAAPQSLSRGVPTKSIGINPSPPA